MIGLSYHILEVFSDRRSPSNCESNPTELLLEIIDLQRDIGVVLVEQGFLRRQQNSWAEL